MVRLVLCAIGKLCNGKTETFSVSAVGAKGTIHICISFTKESWQCETVWSMEIERECLRLAIISFIKLIPLQLQFPMQFYVLIYVKFIRKVFLLSVHSSSGVRQ